MTDREALQSFMDDISCLDQITAWANKVNIFDVLRISRAEIRHSNMLAWLMDPHENHGLGDRVLRGILQRTAQNPPQDYSGFVIRREWNNIDLLAISDTEKYILCIENKTYSGEHDNQLVRYRKLVQATWPEYRRELIYLSRKGRESSDPENWKSMAYTDILKAIEAARVTAQPEADADMLIRHYTEVIRRFEGEDSGIRAQCETIWQKHRKALELISDINKEDPEADPKMEEDRICKEIYEKHQKELNHIFRYKPGRGPDPIADMIRIWVEYQTEQGRITFCPEKTSDATTRFKTRTMSEILPDVAGGESAWGTENFYFYEVRNVVLPSREHELFLQMCVASKNIPEDLRQICDKINDYYPSLQKKKDDWAYRINFYTKHVIFTENDDENKVIGQLEEFLEEAFEFERKLVGKLTGYAV